jgi:iron complex outermembrane recepter protein
MMYKKIEFDTPQPHNQPIWTGSKLRAAVLSAMLAPLAAAPAVQAQNESARTLEEITVTARQRTESLQGVPVAVTVMDESMLQKTFVQNLGELGDYAPNVTIGTVPGFTAASIAIRGVSTGDIPSTFDPAVTVAVDGFYLGHYQASLLDMFDIQQVEVLRGPQGTLFGKNTIGGVINVTTKNPSGDFGVQAKARVGNEGRQDIMAAIDLPIVDDVLAARVSVQQFNFDGFYENTFNGKDAGGQDLLAARAKLLWNPTDTFEALLSFEYIDDDSDTPMVINTTTQEKFFYGAVPGRGAGGPANVPLGDPFKTGLVTPKQHTAGFAESKNTDGHEEEVEGVYLTLNWDLMGGILTSITGYRGVDSDYYNDYVGEPAAIYATIRSVYRDTYSQEIRFAGNTDNLDYVVGGYYQQNDMDYENYTSLGPDHPFAGFDPNIPVGGALLIADGSQEATSYAIFGEGTYAVSDAMSFTAGIRYSDEDKDFELSPLGFPTEARVDESESWDDITYRLGVDYQMSDDTMVYASFSTGFKSGGFNEQAGTLGSAANSFDPEEAESFEVGMKADLLDNTLRLNLAAFYVEYTDLQVDSVVPVPGVGQESIITNAGEVSSYGLEADIMWLATDNLTFDATLGLLDAEYDKFFCDRDQDAAISPDPTPDVDCSDYDVKRTPDTTASLGATYSFEIGNGGLTDLNINATYTDSFYNDIINSESSEHEEVTLLNASVSYFSANEKFRVAVFGRNLTDEEYQTSGLSVAQLWNFSTYGNPLTYGLEVEFNF